MTNTQREREREDNIVRGRDVYAFPISSGEISPLESEASKGLSKILPHVTIASYRVSPLPITGFHPYQSVPLLSLVCEIVFLSSHVMFPTLLPI